MPSLLFICTANRIRSPIAAALYGQLIQHSDGASAANWHIESAGTWATEGQAIDRNAAKVLLDDYDLEVPAHRTKIVSLDMLSSYDLILTMEQDHKEALSVEFPTIAKRVYLMSEMVGATWDLGDPAQHSYENIRITARLIQKVLKDGLGRIRELASIAPTISQ
jgi:protein-tyrosine phosphatase